MKARAGKKKVILELGGNAGVIVDDSADVAWAVKRVVMGGFALRRPELHLGAARLRPRPDLRRVRAAAGRARRRAGRGRPAGPGHRCGSHDRHGRSGSHRGLGRRKPWPRARVCWPAARGSAARSTRPPCWKARRKPRRCARRRSSRRWSALYRFTDFAEALAAVNRSRYGLQAGVFTNDLSRTLAAFDAIEAGGVIVNDVPTWRIDHMPYGGVKDSGSGAKARATRSRR